MSEPQLRSTDRPQLSEEHIGQYQILAELAGIEFSREALEVILQLLSLGAAPNSLNTVLTAICKRPGAGTALRRQPPQGSGPRSAQK
jgi:hypothetical protein